MMKLRPAIAMIELIFAIVIMGITLASAPLLISTSTKSSYVALQQESIAAAATQMNIIMTSYWDHADTNNTLGEPVLTTDTTILNQCSGSTIRPKGTTDPSSGRYCDYAGTSTKYAATSIGSDGSAGELLSYDDVDDYHNRSYSVSVYENDTYTTYEGDYIDKDINLTSSVYYGDDTPRTSAGVAGTYGQTTTFANPFRRTSPTGGATTSNIKIFSITLSSSNSAAELSDKDIRLSAFMCNIGAPKKFINNKLNL